MTHSCTGNLSLFWPHGIQHRQKQFFVVATGLRFYAVMNRFAIYVYMGCHDILKNILISDNATCQQQLISSESTAGFLDHCSCTGVGISLHANKINGCIAHVTAQFLLHGLGKRVPSLLGVCFVNIRNVLRGRGAKDLEDPLLIRSKELSLPLLIYFIGILHRLFFSVMLWVVSFLAALEAIEDKPFHITMELTCQLFSKIFCVKLVIIFLDSVDFVITTSNQYGIDDLDVASQSFECFLQHVTFSFVDWHGKHLHSSTKITRKLVFHQFCQRLVVEFFVSSRKLPAFDGIFGAQACDASIWISSESLGCTVNHLTIFIYFCSESFIWREIILLDKWWV
mmetsp:Transcript_9024/g.21452  ORF Transcript_9024/g.21452 Transcript_9024/m.21452 type:complete len:339 (-) Transcript_9024:119-1135(-)